MLQVRTGTVGFSYRDWMGIFYQAGWSTRKQINVYSSHFDVCELTQFTHQMPDRERILAFTSQLKSDLQFYIRLHNTFTHCADLGLSLSMAKFFKKSIEPFFERGMLGGLVASFPYAFKNDMRSRDYLEQLSLALRFEGAPLQLDFRHPSWLSDSALEWFRKKGLALVCVDEPSMTGLVPPMVVSTASRLLVRFHGRNAQSWWSGNVTSRHDYLYSSEELQELSDRYFGLIVNPPKHLQRVDFIFGNHWQAQAVKNALDWKEKVHFLTTDIKRRRMETLVTTPADMNAKNILIVDEETEEQKRPPVRLSMHEIKSRVNRALFEDQPSFELPIRRRD